MGTFATDDDVVLTLQEAADALGVHYMTAYRYVRLGLLSATKQGGTWRVCPSALDTFRTGSVTAPVEAGERAPWANRLESRLVAGDSRGAWGVVESAMAAGAGIEEIYLDVIAPAMVNIGNGWEAGDYDIAIEHRATAMVLRLIGQIGPRFARRGRRRGTIAITTPANERHGLSVAMIGDLLRLEGWEVSDLGSDLPSRSLVTLVRDIGDIAAVCLSVTMSANLDAFAEMCSTLRREIPEVLIIAGGRAIDDRDHARAFGADEYAIDATVVSELIEADVARRNIAAPVS